jgi:predicted nucleotidyltransferase
MVQRIVKMFHPQQIILFGSHARGESGTDSDVDLLVVMPVRGSVRDMRLKVCGALHDRPFPLDIIVTTPEDFPWRKDASAPPMAGRTRGESAVCPRLKRSLP